MKRLLYFLMPAIVVASALLMSGPQPSSQDPARAIWIEYQDFARVSRPLPRVVYHQQADTFAAAARLMIPNNASWAAGFYARGQVHVRVLPSAEDNRRLLRHELAHALLGRGDTPRWFHEGFAQYMEERRLLPGRPAGLAYAFRLTGINLAGAPAIPADNWQPFYQGAKLAVQYLVATRGEGRLRDLAGQISRGRPFAAAFAEAYGVSIERLQMELWQVSKGDQARSLPL